jgi:hypothetical protein
VPLAVSLLPRVGVAVGTDVGGSLGTTVTHKDAQNTRRVSWHLVRVLTMYQL